ncbi:MAG TPA: hypothetical protein VIV11_02865, partial [Kofleriaceae bacterium]
VVAWFGGVTGVERVGGVRVIYQPPAGLTSFHNTAAAGADVRRCRASDPPPCIAGAFVLDFFQVDKRRIPDLVDVLANGGLAVHEVLETGFARELEPFALPGVELDTDEWQTDNGERHEDTFLRSPSRGDLERTIAAAATRGVKVPAGSEIQFEQVTERSRNVVETYWRTYVLASEIVLDGFDVRSARQTYDQYTNRPAVVVDLTGAPCTADVADEVGLGDAPPLLSPLQPPVGLELPDCYRRNDTTNGAAKFCEVSRRVVGHKVATVLGGRIRSAPIINGPICQGHLWISMGGNEPADIEQEAEVLASALEGGAVARGGSVVGTRWFPAADVRVQEWLGRALFGVLAGLGFGLLCWLVVRTNRPMWRARPPRVAGEFPFGRLFVTLAGPTALLIGSNIALPDINDIEMANVVMRGQSASDGTVIGLSVTPILVAFAIVELVALIVPRWRWRRHDPAGRVRLRQVTALLAVLLALAQGYVAAQHMELLVRTGAEVVINPGLRFELLTMVTLAAGTMLLALLAGIISVHGLANGYAVLIVSGWLLEIGRPLLVEANALPAWLDRTRFIGIAVLAVMMLFTWCVLRWRLRTNERESSLRMPSSGLMALNDSGGPAAIVAALSTLGLAGSLPVWIDSTRGSLWLSVACVIPFAVIWSWILARPSLLERTSMQSGGAPPSRSTWWRATLVSTALLATLTALGWIAYVTDIWNAHLRSLPYTIEYQHASRLADPLMAMIATALLLDMIDGARAHRERLVPIAMLHQIQRIGVVERVLGAAGVRFHIQAANVRTLLAFFGPWAPAIVMVPEASATDAHEKLDGALREPRARLPRATQIRES